MIGTASSQDTITIISELRKEDIDECCVLVPDIPYQSVLLYTIRESSEMYALRTPDNRLYGLMGISPSDTKAIIWMVGNDLLTSEMRKHRNYREAREFISYALDLYGVLENYCARSKEKSRFLKVLGFTEIPISDKISRFEKRCAS